MRAAFAARDFRQEGVVSVSAVIISGISLPFTEPPETAVFHAKTLIGTSAAAANIVKRAVDARHKHDIRFVYSVRLDIPDDAKKRIAGVKNASLAEPCEYRGFDGVKKKNRKPVVVGFGPAGMFAALYLARAGLCPVVLERGAPVGDRVRDVLLFSKTGALDPESNVQFGEGGAGTFSDGKLVTRTNDERRPFILSELVKHGGPAEILIQAKPHIGTDLLRNVVVSIRREILSLGGEILFHTRLEDIVPLHGKLASVKTNRGEIEASAMILAPGHSARDTYEMLHKRGARLIPKAFSVGVRIEHLQSEVDRALYGRFAGHPLLPPTEYQHSLRADGRGVYTFCMCPGGTVVPAATEAGGIVTNGMSAYARDGENANAALVVSVLENDFDGMFGGMKFQRELESAAYSQSGGYKAPVQDIGSFLSGKPGYRPGYVKPSYLPGVTPGDLGAIFPAHITKMLKDGILSFERKHPGFASPDGVLTGVETRTSSPLRILRGENLEAEGLTGVYPCGEGAGHAGGIMSAAADGMRCAEALAKR